MVLIIGYVGCDQPFNIWQIIPVRRGGVAWCPLFPIWVSGEILSDLPEPIDGECQMGIEESKISG